MEFKWQEINRNKDEKGSGFITYRAWVFSGWIVNHICWADDRYIQSDSMVYVPDEAHQWVAE